MGLDIGGIYRAYRHERVRAGATACHDIDDPWDALRVPPDGRWVMVTATRPDLDSFVARRADDARRLGLVPIVHIRTHWNTGIFLGRHKDDPAVQKALRGFYLIEIDYDETCLQRECPGRWARGVVCVSWAQALWAVSPDGMPAQPSASPGKFGPQTAGENAAMLDDFRDLLLHYKTLDPRDQYGCQVLHFTGPVTLPTKLPTVDLCGPDDDTRSYVESLLEAGGPRGLVRVLANDMADAVELRVCEPDGPPRHLRATYVALERVDREGVTQEVLGEWGQSTPSGGTMPWYLTARFEKARVAIHAYYRRDPTSP